MSDVVVIGGGVGSMATAIRLAARGHRVQLFERRHELGGKLTERRRDGFAFGLGPSLLTLPDLFGALAAEAGRKLDELVTLTAVDPVCRYHFPDGSVLDARSDPGAMAAAVERFSPGQGQAWQRYFEWGRRCWAASERAFLSGPLDLPGLARRQASLSDLFASAPGQTLAGLARRFFTDPRLIQYACRYATYSGSSPYQAPAAVGCIPYLEHARGAWYVDGGLARLRDALAMLLADLGVVVHTGTPVSRVLTADGRPASAPAAGWPPRDRAAGVLVAGERVPADIVICGADSARLYRDLCPSRPMRRRIAGIGPSSSAFLLLAGVRGRTSGLAHHNVVFSRDYRAEFADIFDRRRPPADPTIYLGCPAAQDPATAPPGHESLTLLANVPAGSPRSWDRSAADYAELLLGKLDAAGLGVRDRVLFTETLTPADFERRYDGWLGSIYGTSHNGRLAPFRRPGNRGPLAGLYLVGGSVHPGGGLPLVVIGSRIVADLVTEDLATGRI
ncbi:MAG TPA: phytoene desaturase family protein [Streptosporangiaceae bacterium]|jgi:phytoene desaturase|nr:phytoene desaturase family protein [Streptosporangiaceae bacterium]